MPESTNDTSSVLGSVLLSVKKNVGVPPDVTTFDADLILLINSVFAELNQLGVGPEQVFSIEDETSSWDEFITSDSIQMVKAYMFLEVKMMFDPPTSAVLTAMEKKRDEYEWRLNVAGDKSAFE